MMLLVEPLSFFPHWAHQPTTTTTDEPELGREIEQRASNSRRPNADWGEEEGGHLFRCTRCYVIPETIFSLRAMLPLSPEADSIIVLVLLWRVYGLQSCFTANSLIPRGEVALHLGNSNVSVRHRRVAFCS